MAETPAKAANAAGGNNTTSSGPGTNGGGGGGTDGATGGGAGTSGAGGASGGAGGGAASANAAAGPGGIPYYEKQRQYLKELINRKRTLDKKIVTLEELIYSKETDYLENTPGGNIITGFDNYTKGTTNAAAQRRKTGLTDANRVFSRSSVSYNPSAQQEAQTPGGSTTHSTPGSLAPTPLSTSFKDKDRDGGGASGAPTPTSATAGKASSSKKGKKTTSKASGAGASNAASRAASAGGDDSETDSKDAGGATKKIRTNFGASRKN